MRITLYPHLIARCVLTFWLVYYSPTLSATPPAITLEVTPLVVSLGSENHVRVRVTPNPENRWLCLAWGKADEDMRSSFCEQFDGAGGRITTEYGRTLREPGKWTFSAWTVTSDEKVHSAMAVDVQVVGGF